LEADDVVPGIANHITKFWDPRMRDAIFALREALDKLKEQARRQHPTESTISSSFQGT